MNTNITLWLVRHGETLENRANICQGQTHGTLSDKGIAQAIQLGRRLKNRVFDQIWTSDLKRARHTTDLICQTLASPVSVREDIRLRERSFGSFQGQVFPENRTGYAYPDDVESISGMGIRLSSFLRDLHTNNNHHVLIVTHGVALRVMLSLLLFGDTTHTDQLPLLANASVTRVRIEGGRVVETDYNPCDL